MKAEEKAEDRGGDARVEGQSADETSVARSKGKSREA
jgi:hypothetical protein